MKILVGVSGSIGVLNIHSYLISLRSEPEVEELRVVMTPTAARFVNPQGLEALLRLRVHVDSWSDPRPMLPPPELVHGIDLYLIAPASATTLSRCAAGAADTLLANCYLNWTGPVAFAPAMAPEMWEHPAVRQNVARLESFGARFLPMGKGWSAAAGKVIQGSLCPYQQMWPLLKAFALRPAAEADAVDSSATPHAART
jgi:phosphopantothenoylcysteine decarboxylase/phosphopantothenate--cysteine ligase